jgi:DNA replication protein DnaD
MVIDLNALIITLNVGYPYTQIIIERLKEWLKTDRTNLELVAHAVILAQVVGHLVANTRP